MKTKFLASAILVWLGTTTSDASACGGGMFLSSSSTAKAAGHRVVISMSSTQTVLWDQIEFDGNPADFAWVLPVQKGAYLQVATDAFLEALEAGTAARVESPMLRCGSDPGCTCGSYASAPGGGETPRVTVVHQGTAGPYETVTLSTDAGNGAIANWLTSNGYAIPADIAPILDEYVAKDFDFIALRLKPSASIKKMKPVRVVTPGGSPTFPLRMLAAGAGESVGLVLYVITEGRVEVSGFKNAVIRDSDLVFDFDTNKSNYETLRDGIFKANPGTFVTASAMKNTLLNTGRQAVLEETSPEDSWNGYEPVGTSIANAYFSKGLANGEGTGDCSMASAYASANWDSYDMVANPCPFPESPKTCGTLLPFRIDSRNFDCENLTDLSVALTGLHPVDVWVTRLEARLPKDLLKQDLTFVPASSQSERHFKSAATKASNAPCELYEANISGLRPSRSAAAIFSGLVGVFVTFGRRRSRKKAAKA